MKVVINTCFGGFSLSPAGTKRYWELKGRKCYFFRHARKADGGIDLDRYEGPISIKEIGKDGLFFSTFDIPNPNDNCLYPDNWHSLPDAEKKKYNDAYSRHFLSNREIERNDPILIQVVEELGAGHKTGASGSCAELTIVEIPDGVEWEIEEYDGNEHVAEKHRTWR